MTILIDHDTDIAFSRSAGQSNRDRYTYDRQDILEQCLEAWRVNPLARRIVGLTSQYVVGGGVEFSCKHEATSKFIKDFWDHRLNRMTTRIYEWCDELTRSGNLFVLLTTDAAGMSYVRTIPALDVQEIISADNDIEQEIKFEVIKPQGNTGELTNATLETITYPAYNEDNNLPAQRASRLPPTVILHYAVNKPTGAQWGEPDLAPLLRWLARYANWLEDRARLNRYRNSFVFVVKGKYLSPGEKASRQAAINANPPAPGSVLVTDDTETWEILNPNLQSSDANEDGLALKKMISAGAGIPLHFLAEPESSTRTTAEAAGGPTFRHFEQRQQFFLWMLKDILTVVISRRAHVDHHVSSRADFDIVGSDISARDNVALSMAASNMTNVMKAIRDRGLISDEEMLRMIYRSAGEVVDMEELLAEADPPYAAGDDGGAGLQAGLPTAN